MTNPAEDRLIADLARQQVARMAPKELPLYQMTSEAYFEDPKAVEAQAGKDEMLGFGVEAGVAFLTPVALAVTTEVVKFIASELRKSVEAESSGVIREFIEKIFKRFRPAEKEEEGKMLPPLTQEQIVRVRELAFEKGRQLDLPETQAGLLADSLIGSLATAASQQGTA
jgi:hypothetical protein